MVDRFSIDFAVLEKCYFFVKLTTFSCRCSNWLQIAKNKFSRFSLFTPLFRRVTLSSVAHASGFDEIYRSVSKIINFMASGSISENLSKIYRKPIEHLSKIYRESIEHLSNIYRTSIETLSNIYRNSIEHLSNIYRTSIESPSKIWIPSQKAWNEDLLIRIDRSRQVPLHEQLHQRAWNAEVRG